MRGDWTRRGIDPGRQLEHAAYFLARADERDREKLPQVELQLVTPSVEELSLVVAHQLLRWQLGQPYRREPTLDLHPS